MPPARREFLRASAAVATASATALAGCQDSSDGSTPAETPTTTHRTTPEQPQHRSLLPGNVAFVATLDTETILETDSIRSLVSTYLETAPFGLTAETDLETALSDVESTVGLDPERTETVTLFATETGGAVVEDSTVLVDGEWSNEAVIQALPAGYERINDADVPRYRSADAATGEGTHLAVLAGGRLVFGRPEHVDAVLAIGGGDADPTQNAVTERYAAANGDLLRYATALPENAGEGLGSGFESATHLAGGVFTDDGRVGTEHTISTADATTAPELADTVEGLLALVRLQVETESISAVLDTFEVEQTGPTVTVTGIDDPGDVEAALRAVAETRTETSDAPSVAFGTEYDAETGVLTVVHASGDHVTADTLYVDGEELADSQRGNWAALGGEVSGDDGMVRAGDALVLGDDESPVPSGARLNVLWRAPNGDLTVLDTWQGPDA